MTRALALLLPIMLFLYQIIPVSAHGVARVRKQLEAQGYEQLEFRRKKPPFKLNACLKGELFHLHVDFYGKIIEKSAFGSCESDSYDQENANSEDDTQSTTREEQTDDTKDVTTSKTEDVTTSKAEDDEPVSDEAAFKAMRRWGVDLRKEPKN